MLDDRLIKRAHKKLRYTEEQIEELAKCMDPVNGPMYFMCNFVYVQHPQRGRIKFDPYPFQIELVDAYHNYRKSIALVSRQMGKSTVAAAYLLWYAMFVDNSLIIVASKTHGDAIEIMQKVRFAYEEVPDHIRDGVHNYNKKSIEFQNGSRILSEATTDNTGRGKAVSLIYLDEFAFVETRMARELWRSLSPTLSTGGKIIITSTPNTDEDQFAELWLGAEKTIDEYGNERSDGIGINGFKPYKAIWDRHPDRDQKWADEQKADLGLDGFRREHLCKFVTFDETLISGIKLLEFNETTMEPIRKSGQVRWYKDINQNCTYIVALDPAMGTGGDNAAIQVIELPTLEQVAEWQHNKSPVETQLQVLREISKEIQDNGDPEIYWSVENNAMGEAALAVIRETGEELFPGTMIHDPKRTPGSRVRKGFNTTNRAKIEACAKLKSWIEKDKFIVRSRNLASELKTFVARMHTYEAKPGMNDDLVMAVVLAIRMIAYIASWDDETYKAVNESIAGDEYTDDDMPMPMGFL